MPDGAERTERCGGWAGWWTAAASQDSALPTRLAGERPVVRRGQADSTEQLHIVTVWAPLVDTDARNGALTLVPGSQRWGMLDGQRDADSNMQAYGEANLARVEVANASALTAHRERGRGHRR